MLGKLLKHDMKALSRYLMPLHIAVLVLAVLGRLFVSGRGNWSNPSPLLLFFIIGFTLVLLTIMTATSIIVAVYFYRNLFSKHGYLSWTIPASASQHLASKTITGYAWVIINYLIIIGAVVFFFAIPDIPWNEIAESFTEELGISFSTFWGTTFIIGIIGSFCTVMSFYIAIVLGQLFSNHRVLGAVIVYFVLTLVVQILASVVLFIGPDGLSLFIAESLTAPDYAVSWGSQYLRLMWTTGIVSLVEGIVFYVITYYIMNKKLNLN